MILTVGNVKGGVGKTTLAINLAIALGRDVLLIDGDEQGTALAFTELRTDRRGASDYTVIALHGTQIRNEARRLVGKYAHLVIDVGGRDTGSFRAALTISNLLLIPSAPRSFDLWGVEETIALVREAREVNPGLRAVAVLNCADHQGGDNLEALQLLGEIQGLEVLPCLLSRRKAYPDAAARGLGILEFASHSNPGGVLKAQFEFREVFKRLFPGEKLHARKKSKKR
jgi:chromosome partitioning protein